MINPGYAPKNESMEDGEVSRFTYQDYKEMDPRDYDDGQVKAWIKNFELAAKMLGVDKSKMVHITEENPSYDKLIKFTQGQKAGPVRGFDLDGKAGFYNIYDSKMITTNEWGYGTIYISLQGEKALLKARGR